MTSREAFEAHIQAKTGEKPQMIGGFDTNLRWREDWEIWQAAYEAGRTAERSACADVCDGVATAPHPILQTALKCAEAIRARGKP